MVKHGMSKSREWKTWVKMRERCLNPDDPSYSKYGARGITICDRWARSFSDFYADMGPKPAPGDTIDRIDNTKGYEPANCRWADKRIQALNRRRTRWIEYEGVTLCKKDWALKLGVARDSLSYWFAQGFNFPEIVEHFTKAPVNRQTRYAWQQKAVLRGHDLKLPPPLIPEY